MKHLLRLLLLVLLVCSATRGQSATDPAFEAVAKRGIDEVYNLDFEKADEDFGKLIVMNPHHPAGYFFQGMVVWWKIMLDIDNEQYDRQFFTLMDHVIDMCDSILDRDEDNLDAVFFKGGSIGFKGRLNFHRDDYLAAANAGRKALPLVEKAQELAPHDYDVLLGAGIYNYCAEVVPQEYPFLKPVLLFIPPGDKKRGIEQLQLAAQKGRYAKVEAAYFLMQIEFYYEKDFVRTLQIALDLHTRYPNNMLFHKYVGRCYVLMNNWQAASALFTDICRRVKNGQRGYDAVSEREAEYYLGQYDMNNRRLDSALVHLYRCDELSRPLDRSGPSGFMTMANLRIGNIYDLQGKRELAMREYEKVAGWKDYKGSVGLAEQYLKSPYIQ